MHVFDKPVQKSIEWLKEAQHELGWEERETYNAVLAVLHTLRDRLPAVEAMHLAAQLPMVLKGAFYEGYNPSWKPDKDIKTAEDFYSEVCQRSSKEIDARQATDAVMKVLTRKVSPGEIEDILANLPKQMKGVIKTG